jgi:tetratricopeptide (TPR) repeat protein
MYTFSGMKLRFLVSAIAAALFFVPATPASAQPYLDSARIATLLKIQDMIFDDRFTSADSAATELIETSPADPIGYLLRASNMLAEMTDQEENLYSKRFERLLDTTETIARKAADTADTPTQAWMHLILGHIQAYRSLYESRFGSFATAIRKGLAVRGEYQKALELDSSLYDIYAGLGGYHYWKSVKAGFLRWIGIFRNDKDKGIRELRLAADSSIISRQTASSALIWVWLDAKQYDSAIAEASKMLELHPSGRTFMWPLGQAFFQKADYERTVDIYTRLRDVLAAHPGNYFNLIACDRFLTLCWQLRNQTDKAREAAARFAEYRDRIPESVRKRQSEKIEYLEEIMNGR